MRIDLTTGLIQDIPFHASPYTDLRPPNTAIDLLVIHGISLPPGEFGQGFIHQLFMGHLDHSQHPYFQTLIGVYVSAHILIERNGEITQYVPLTQRAWHAGVSCYKGQTNCNDFSIGIELEGTDHLPYTDAQYKNLTHLTLKLMQAYPAITSDHIVGHSDIAPERKTDPGPAFDWKRFRSVVSI